jgi:seryl-tRNA synthetase
MIDLKFIRKYPEKVQNAIWQKKEKTDIADVLALDTKRSKLVFDVETITAARNKFAHGNDETHQLDYSLHLLAGLPLDNILTMQEKLKLVSQKIKEFNQLKNEVETDLNALLLRIPNLPHPDVPVGMDESFNKYIREWGTKPELGFAPKDHQELAVQNNMLDMLRGAKVTGSGFPVYTGLGAKLERALINFMLTFHVQKHGYEEVAVPFIVNRKSMTGTGQLPKLENDMYHIDEEDYFLIPTAEVPITNLYSDEIMPLNWLPKKLVGYTPCFRREAGSYGKDTKGLQRVHQFNKVEMVRFVHPDESYAVLEEMVTNAEAILKALGLHYRVIELCTSDLSFASARTYDLEVWAPGTGRYLEVSSVSNYEDFQARRAGIRFRDNDGKVRFVHTLNGSGLATPRTMIAIMETYQQADGSIAIPEVLKPWLDITV